MQSKGGGKHDILSVGQATATTLNCLWMRPRDPDGTCTPHGNGAGEHGGVHGASELHIRYGLRWQAIQLWAAFGQQRKSRSLGSISAHQSNPRSACVQVAPKRLS
jgi:hypothetical protein